MNWLKRKWQAWRDARKAELRRRGYDYAAGHMVCGQGAQEAIQRLETEASGTLDFNEFDQGIGDALFDWTRLHPEVTTQTLSERRKLQDWADATALGRASTVEAFAAPLGYDPEAVEAELKADNQERNPAEQQLDAAWREAQDATVTQSLVDLATAALTREAPERETPEQLVVRIAEETSAYFNGQLHWNDPMWLAENARRLAAAHSNAALADRAPRDPDYYGHPKCNRVTNSPCDWSNSGPLADTCKVCDKNFPTWN